MKKIAVLVILALSILFFLNFKVVTNKLNSYFYTQKSNETEKTAVIYKIGLLADSHSDYQQLKKSITKLKQKNVDFLIHFGDMSDFGGLSELEQTKKILDESEIEYLVIPGDRDIVEGGVNFNKIFKNKVCDTQLLNKYRVICLANPYNYTLIDSKDYEKFIKNSKQANILLTAQPIYNPKSNIYMGFYDTKVKEQADNIFVHILNNTNIKYVISADTHFFKTYSGDKNSNIKYYNLGAITDKRNLQSPNFAIMNIYENGTTEIKQLTIN